IIKSLMFSVLCQSCGYNWLSASQEAIVCPKCQENKIQVYPAQVVAYVMSCERRGCGVLWYDQTNVASCIRCGKKTKISRPVWFKHTESFTLPFRTRLSLNVEAMSKFPKGTQVFRLECSTCGLYWLDTAKEASCHQCNTKSTTWELMGSLKEELGAGVRGSRRSKLDKLDDIVTKILKGIIGGL
ncbi:MAG: hypothetical protein ACFFBD_27120, partial [Candidatus Hodarchaeota archaeon]